MIYYIFSILLTFFSIVFAIYTIGIVIKTSETIVKAIICVFYKLIIHCVIDFFLFIVWNFLVMHFIPKYNEIGSFFILMSGNKIEQIYNEHLNYTYNMELLAQYYKYFIENSTRHF